MNNIIYFVIKGLALGTIAAISTSTSLTVPFSETKKETVFVQILPSPSTSVTTQLVETETSDRNQNSVELLQEQDNHNTDLEKNSLAAVKQTKYIRKPDSKREFTLAKTVTLVKELEGFRASAYVDTDGTVVIGYGMPQMAGKKVKLGDRISQVQAETDLTKKLQEIQQQILATATVELNSNQLVALSSFAFNVGVESLFKSTLFRKLNYGDSFGAANEFVRWNKAHSNGRLVPFAGLTRRRLMEKNLFLTAVN